MSYGLLELDQLRFPEKQRMQLILWTWSNAIRTVVVEGFTKSGLIHFRDITTADRAVNEATEDILELPIAVHVRLDSTSYDARRGECYAKLMLLLGTYQHVLCQGYLCDRMHTLTYPGGTHEHSTEGMGLARIFEGTNPAAGVDISEVVPANTLWLLRSIKFTLTTDANVIDRTVNVAIKWAAAGTSIWKSFTAGAVQAASLTRAYIFCPHVPADTAFDFGNNLRIPMPETLCPEGATIYTNTNNKQAGDDYSAPEIELQEWIRE